MNNNKKHITSRWLKWTALVLLACYSANAFAVEEPYMNELKGSQVAAHSVLTVSDEKFNSSGSWSLIQQNISVDDIVTFEINFDTSIYFYNQPFSCTINFKIYIYGNQADTSQVTDSATHSNISLEVRYDTTTGRAYKGIAQYKFKNAHKYKIRILSITSPQYPATIPAIFRLKSQVIVNRKYNFNDNSTDVTRFTVVNGNQLLLEWTPSLYPGAEMFDLEYTHIDKNSQPAASILTYAVGSNYAVPADSLAKWFKNNNTRITTAAAAYLINVPYDSGFILFRIRGVQIHYPDDLRWEGNWNYTARPVSLSCSGSSDPCPSGVVKFNGHEQNLNWQLSIVFAEEGKRKEVVSYFDGSLRNRQSVTINNTDNKTVVQETVYDALGRAAASILPAPAPDSTIHYFRGFNKNKDGNPYSFSDLLYGSGCVTAADSISYVSGTGRYYSSSNQFQSAYHYAKYIPHAGGYPLAVTEYMADNTGRIKAQGGVGPAFQPGQNHDTKYFYGKPTQTELDRLFGSEAGDASHYLKTMTQDANGQVSVRYQDAGGRNIATALAGATPTYVHSLPSGSGAAVQVTSELITPRDFIRNPSDYSLVATATFLAAATGDYDFHYRVDPISYKKLFGPDKDSAICSDCYYDLEITIKDDCNNLIERDTVPAGTVFDTACATLPDTIQGVINTTLIKIGEYYITYTLRVSEDALNFYDSVHLVKNSDIKKLNYFLLEELKNTDFYGCYSNCETCLDNLGTKSEFLSLFKKIYAADSLSFGVDDSTYTVHLYDSLYAHCQSIQVLCKHNVCDDKLAMLKLDVSPGGQYALYNSSNYDLIERPINRLDVAWRNQVVFFTNEWGVRDSVMLYKVDGEDSIKVDVKDLNDSLFIKNWKDVWADSLVRLHPEYCFYLWCVANDSSYTFDRDIENWADADTAKAFGWFNPPDYKALLDKDPFFKPGANGAALYNKMKKSLRLFSRSYIRNSQPAKNILQFIDIVLYCKTQYNGWMACNPDSACRSRNREWFLYKTLYLNLKQKYYEEARRNHPQFSTCINCQIGNDIVEDFTGCPEISDFTIESDYPHNYIIYNQGIGGGVPRRTKLVVRSTGAFGMPGSFDVVFNPGQTIVDITMFEGGLNYVMSVTCDLTGIPPCAPPKEDFVLRNCLDSGVVVSDCKEYYYSGTLTNRIILKYHVVNSACPSGCIRYVAMDPGDSAATVEYGSITTTYTLLDVFCDTTLSPFTDSTCNYTCPGGIYDPYGEDSVLYYISYGYPMSPPAGYGNCQFYPAFDIYMGPDTSCRFLNVWVCVYDSTCGGICTVTDYPSYCPATSGTDTLYKHKQRRYPEYVNPDELLQQLAAGNPQQASQAQEDAIIEECANTCEAQADYWIRTLGRCSNISNPSLAASLRAALVDICSRGCSMSSTFGTSSIPSSVPATYHSFEEAIEGILGPGAINDSCTAELLAMPYPHNRQPVVIERVIMETDYDICQKLGQFRTAYLSSGYSGSFHQYMQYTYGSAYTLDSTGLYDMVNACLNCNGILKNDIVLPAFFEPQSRPCLRCDSINAGVSAFNAKFPALSTTDDDYENLFANFLNHRFGFSHTYTQYKTFLDSCTANGAYTGRLCNAPTTEDVVANDNGCVIELFHTALTNATSIYIAYIDSVRRDFREAWLTKCMNVQARLSMTADLYEYHYTLYYYDQSGNLVKTVPPEGVKLLTGSEILQVQQKRNSGNNSYCNNSNAMAFSSGGAVLFSNALSPQLVHNTQPFTVECWMKLSSFSDQGVLSNTRTFPTSPEKGYAVKIKSGKLVFLMAEGTSTTTGIVEVESLPLAGFVTLNTWNHFACERTNSGNGVKIYINGNEIPFSYVNNSFTTGNIPSVSNGFLVGAAFTSGALQSLNGSLKHVRMYKRAVPQAELRQNYFDFCGNPSNSNALVFWETFNEGAWSSGTNPSLSYVYERMFNLGGYGYGSGLQNFESSSGALVPEHRLVTTYQYNSLNQVLQQYSPDGDTSVFFYDRLGRLTVSQNKEQKENSSYSGTAGRFSYTLYDALGRITEVGEKSGPDDDIRDIDMLDTLEVKDWLASGTNKQITKTIYDNPINTYQSVTASRKRVVAGIYLEAEGDAEGDSTLYAYDILGNVKTLVQHVKTLVAVDAANGKKRVDYDYDLVSGKVNMVSYQPGKGDQFFYKYLYDADNRVIRSLSSRDKLTWLEDASYTYYLHGPLARTELGQYKVQGVDYAYTLQGWMKGINSNALSPQYEMGQDGWPGTGFARVSRDVYSYGLGYYNGDYTPIGGSGAAAMTQAAYTHPAGADNTGRQLFNGNISHTEVALGKIDGGAAKGYSYGYDQLNRLVFMNQHTIGSSTYNNTNIITAYAESIAYDANGNILKYMRNGANGAAGPLKMDSLSYKYNRDVNGNIVNNRLNHVRDSVSSGNYTVDIDDQSADNYVYDMIGNLKMDIAEGISNIDWTVYGKIKNIEKPGTDVSIVYGYDGGGNRTWKQVLDVSGEFEEVTNTWYIRDAQGNTLAVYSKKNAGSVKWDEQHLYGSSRLGMWNYDTTVPASPPIVGSGGTPIYDSILCGSRTYELSNHLGNVLATISDKKAGHNNSGVVDYYLAEVLTQNDYYPFGMGMPGRAYSAVSGYRYGFNGKEKSQEITSDDYDFGARIYDARIGRWLSVDPLQRKYPDLNPYHFCGNNPVRFIDFDGRDFGIKIDHVNKTIVIVGNYHTGSKKAYEQAQKAAKLWNDKTAVIDGYTVSFKLEVLQPPSLTDEEVYKRRPKVIDDRDGDKGVVTEADREGESDSEARRNANKDKIGNYYTGGDIKYTSDLQKGTDFEGGETREGKRINMHYHKDLGDLGEKTKAVGHEIGHTLGLKDPPDPGDPSISGDYYTSGGIMEYKLNLDDLNLPSDDDVKNIVNYAKDFLNQGKNFYYKEKAKVTLLEVNGTATKSNPLGKVAMNPVKGPSTK